ncbi:10310_t:CDS:2, partial [Funneliformis geosporum]
MEEIFNYWHEKSCQNQYLDHEANEQGILAKSRASEIKNELSKNQNIKTCCDKDCPHYLSIKDYPAPTSPKTGGGGKPASNKTNQISPTDKNQLLQYFLTYHITKITLDNGKLVVEYDNSQKGQKVNNSELEKYKKLIQNQPNHSLSLSDLQNNSDSNSTKNPDHKLAIGLALGAGAVILGGIIEATARVYLKEGKGQAQVRTKNGKEKDLKGYFYMEPSLYEDIFKPLKLFSKENEYDLLVRVKGSGFHAQAEAIRLGVAQAMLKISPEYKTTLKSFSLLTRDARRVEPKKIGQSGKSDDMERNITYNFDLETPLLFLSAFLDKKVEYKYLKIKTSKNENDFFLNTNNEGGIGKGAENFRVKIENHFIQDETQNFDIDFNEIELESEKCDKLHSAIENCIEKGQSLVLKLNFPKKTYFRKGYFNNQVINTLVIPESSLQENSNGS